MQKSWSSIKGFNYQPSYGSSGLELWTRFDQESVELELSRGRRHFPGMNAIRLWLSWDAFNRNPQGFAANFARALAIADALEMRVMPVLFNRWHDCVLDYGGTYADHFLPGASWVQKPELFTPYLEAIVGAHASDPRVLAWDLCNEPFAYGRPAAELPEIYAAEQAWLRQTRDACKRLGAAAPITIGTHMHSDMTVQEPLMDVIGIHPYWWPTDAPDRGTGKYEQLLDSYVALGQRTGKPLIASETCWGSLDDGARVEIIRYTLGQLKKRGIGWLAYLLHHSLIADAHRPEFGPTGRPGNLAFIEADGSLRPGHGVFNEF